MAVRKSWVLMSCAKLYPGSQTFHLLRTNNQSVSSVKTWTSFLKANCTTSPRRLVSNADFWLGARSMKWAALEIGHWSGHCHTAWRDSDNHLPGTLIMVMRISSASAYEHLSCSRHSAEDPGWMISHHPQLLPVRWGPQCPHLTEDDSEAQTTHFQSWVSSLGLS